MRTDGGKDPAGDSSDEGVRGQLTELAAGDARGFSPAPLAVQVDERQRVLE
jgi:hypothetical protein